MRDSTLHFARQIYPLSKVLLLIKKEKNSVFSALTLAENHKFKGRKSLNEK